MDMQLFFNAVMSEIKSEAKAKAEYNGVIVCITKTDMY